MKNLLFCALIGVQLLCAGAPAMITNTFVHNGPSSDRIVFYLDRMPTVHGEKNTFTLRNISWPDEQQKRLVRKHAHWYDVRIHKNNNDVTLTFDKKRHAFTLLIEQKKNIHELATIGITISKTHATKVTPQKTPLIAIDCGHGGHDLGTHQNGLIEKDVVLNIGTHLEQFLQEHGYRTLMTRADDRFVALDERTTHANMQHATLFVSLHNDANTNHQQHGVTVFYENAHSKKLAEIMYQALTNLTNQPHLYGNGVRQELAQVIYGTTMPAVIVELLFLSNTTDAKLLGTQDGQKLLAERVAHGIINFLHLSQATAPVAQDASQDRAKRPARRHVRH